MHKVSSHFNKCLDLQAQTQMYAQHDTTFAFGRDAMQTFLCVFYRLTKYKELIGIILYCLFGAKKMYFFFLSQVLYN